MSEAPPKSVLFACNLNSIRSPIAAGLMRKRYGGAVMAQSCGVYEGGYLDPFMVQALQEAGVDASDHEPRTFEEAMIDEFDLIIALTPESYRAAVALARDRGARVEFWPITDPTVEAGSRDARLNAYRSVRDQLDDKIRSRFGPLLGPT